MQDKKFQIGLVQMDSATDWEKNRKEAQNYIRSAAEQGASLVIFPETVDYIGEDFRGNATEVPGRVTDFFREQAAKYGICLHCGSITEKVPGKAPRNTSYVFGTSGEKLGQYSKLHLFDVELENGPSYRESDDVSGGKEIVLVETPLCTMGLSICYDMRFPELFRLMAERGAQLLVNCANFTANTGKDHWEPLLRARAIENTCYVAAVGQCGKKPKFQAWGHTVLVSPWGEILGMLGEEPGLLLGEIDLGKLEQVRRQIPSLKNVRKDIYHLESEQVRIYRADQAER